MFSWIKKWITNSNDHHCYTNMIYKKPIIKEHFVKSVLKNSIAMTCINYIHQNIRNFKIHHNGNNFFFNDIYILMEDILMEWLFHGNVFIIFNEGSLQVLSTSKIQWNNNKFYYGGQLLKHYIHIKNYNLYDGPLGISPIESIISHIEQYNIINEYLQTIAGRGGITSGIITSKNPLNNTTREKLQEDIKNFYRNLQSQGTIMILEGEFSWTSIAISPQDLDIKKMNQYNGSAIARGLGVHPVLIGLDKRSYGGLQYNNIRQQFIEDSLKPLYNKIITMFKNQCKIQWQWSLNIDLDYDQKNIIN